MAWRIEEAVTHGVIDNTVEGHTSGQLWLCGRDEPLELSLAGDCWRDLAGSRLTFENPSPKEDPELAVLDRKQDGIVGDMTASRKNRIPTVNDDECQRLYDEEKEIPFEWKNTLYLEWFSDVNGRVVIESAAFRMKVSPHEWQMDADAEEAQKLANLNAMRDFMAQVIKRPEPSDHDAPCPEELDEYAWEERLKESDRLTDAYQEVLEKYMEDSDGERKEAFVMGWDGLLEALADNEEKDRDGSSADDDGEDGDEDWRGDGEAPFDGDDEDDGFSDYQEHPLQAQAQELAMRAMDVVPNDPDPNSAPYQLVTALLQVSGKLAGALNDRGSGYEPETGYVLAVLKRCLNWLNDAVGACQTLIEGEEDPDQLAALSHLRSSAFEIRDQITELRREMK